MKVSPELAKRMIKAQGFRRLECFTPDRSELIYRAEGTPDELMEAVDDVVGMVGGIIRMEASTPRRRDENGHARAGRKSEGERPMVVLVSGAFGDPRQLPADGGLAARLDRLEALLLAKAEEEEEEEEDTPSEEVANRVLDLLERAIEGKAGNARAERPASPPPVSGPASAADSAEEARAIAVALANLRKQDPQAFAMYRHHLLQQYGGKRE